jgi:hypothetical protein
VKCLLSTLASDTQDKNGVEGWIEVNEWEVKERRGGREISLKKRSKRNCYGCYLVYTFFPEATDARVFEWSETGGKRKKERT